MKSDQYETARNTSRVYLDCDTPRQSRTQVDETYELIKQPYSQEQAVRIKLGRNLTKNTQWSLSLKNPRSSKCPLMISRKEKRVVEESDNSMKFRLPMCRLVCHKFEQIYNIGLVQIESLWRWWMPWPGDLR